MTRGPVPGDAVPVLGATAAFATREGRRPRVLVLPAHCGDLQLDPWALITALADLGFDVDVAAGSGEPGDVARQAVDNDVHLVAIPASPMAPTPASLRAALTAGGGDGILLAGYGAATPDPTGVLVARFTPDVAIATTALALTDILNHPAP